jgi:YD repeat-containing protein
LQTPIADFDVPSRYISQNEEYEYNSPTHTFKTSSSSVNSNGDQRLFEYKYPKDYDTIVGTADQMTGALKLMLKNNLVKYPIEVVHKVNDKVTDAELTLFRVSENNFLNVDRVLKCQFAQPIEDNSLIRSEINSINQFEYDSKYKVETIFDKYTEFGRLQQFHGLDNIKISYIWGYGGSLVIAQVENAGYDNIFHTSFEDDPTTETFLSQSKTGKYAHQGTFEVILSDKATGQYVLQYWISNDGIYWTENISDLQIANESTSIVIGSSGSFLDEVRLIPKGSVIRTMTYSPLVGLTSNTDANGNSTYYEYDSTGRLVIVRDNSRNILKQIKYNYAQ